MTARSAVSSRSLEERRSAVSSFAKKLKNLYLVGGEDTHDTVLQQLRPQMMELAFHARLAAESYRDFLVGVSILAWNGHRYRLFYGWNTKDKFDPQRKNCAEEKGLRQVNAHGYHTVVAIMICGQPLKEQGQPCLLSCNKCRSQFDTEFAVVREDTKIISFNHWDPTKVWVLTKKEMVENFSYDTKLDRTYETE